MFVYKNGNGKVEVVGETGGACLICGEATRWQHDPYCRACHEYSGDELPSFADIIADLTSPHPRHS